MAASFTVIQYPNVNSGSLFQIGYSIQSDASGNMPQNIARSGVAGFYIASVEVVFATPAPNSVTVAINTTEGLSKISGTLTSSGILTQSAPLVDFPNGYAIGLSGNTTANAQFEIVVSIQRA